MKILCLFLAYSLLSFANAADSRTYGANQFGSLSLNGQPAALLKDASGGNVVGKVVEELMANEPFPRKHIASITYDDVVLKTGVDVNPVLSAWMQEMGSGNIRRLNGAITDCDLNGNPVAQREFFEGLLTEIIFPDIDASVKDPGLITLKITPEQVRAVAPREKCMPGRQRNWITNNFRLELDGLDTAKVSKIDSFSIKLKVLSQPTGGRDTTNEPKKTEFTNLRVTVSNTTLKSWRDWNESFLVRGQSGDQFEKAGAIVLLDPTLKEIARVKLQNVGLIKMAPAENSNDAIARTVVDLYVEKMEFVPLR